MIRRTFQLPADNNLGVVEGQVLVTYNELTGELHCATRPHTWDTWSTPMPEVDAQDDAPGSAMRVYPSEGGRAYDPLQYVPNAAAVAEAEGAKEWHDAVQAAGLPVASDPPVNDPDKPDAAPAAVVEGDTAAHDLAHSDGDHIVETDAGVPVPFDQDAAQPPE